MNPYKLKPSRYSSQAKHARFGIQTWLLSKDVCRMEGSKSAIDRDQYRDLLKAFIERYAEEESKLHTTRDITTLEDFVQRRFQQFASFVTNRHNPNKSYD